MSRLSYTTHWAGERTETLVRLWEEGKSAGLIARLLGGLTRNAVIGKAYRLGLRKRGAPVTALDHRSERKAARVPPIKRKPDSRATMARIPRVGPAQPAPPAPPAPPALPPVHDPVRFLARKACQCPFPLWGEGAPLEEKLMCGAPTDGGYCAEHRDLCFKSGTQRDFDNIASATMRSSRDGRAHVILT